MEQPTDLPTTPAGMVAAANVLVGDLDETLWAAKSSEELVDAVAEAEVLRAQLAALESSMLAEIEARQVPKSELAWGSTSDWFTHLAGLTRQRGTAPCGRPRSWSASGPRRMRRCSRAGCRRSRPR